MAKRDNDLEFSMNAAFDEARAVVDKVPLYLINGSLGAGKTSVLEFLLQQSDFKGSRVIENEFANENIDGYRLEKLTEIVATLSGDCVCCGSEDALTKLLMDFARNSPAPVFIEATGVAQTINLVERLVNSKIFEKYELMHSFYVIDAQEILRGIDPAHEIELQAADTVLVTKEDLLSENELADYENHRSALPYARVLSAPYGQFSLEDLPTPSGLISFFDSYDGELAVPDNPRYSVIDVSHLKTSEVAWQALWSELFAAYDLRRLKGCFVDESGARRHIEATPQQIAVTNARPDEAAKIVLIGAKADEISRDNLAAMLMMAG